MIDKFWKNGNCDQKNVITQIFQRPYNLISILVIVVEELDELEVSESRKLSSMSQDDAPLFEEFRSAFQEISDWISRAEAKLGK